MFKSELVINKGYKDLNPVQFGYEKCKPKHSFGPAVRTHWLLHYVVSGCGYFIRDKKKYTVSGGEIFVIPPFEETYYEADSVTPWHYIWIGFEAETLPFALDKAVINCLGAGRIFNDMLRCSAFENGRSAFLCGKLWELFCLLLEQSGAPKSGYVEKAINRMNSEYMNDISISEIAKQLNIDRSYFSSIFKKSTGLSPQFYLNNLRLERAAELMIRYGQPPSTAAISSGYPDIYNFSKMFKRHFGVSPREYVKRNRESAKEDRSL